MVRQITFPTGRYDFSVTSARDEENRLRLQTLCTEDPDPFGRCEDHGHVTTSALITDSRRDHVLLTHHAKLGIWLPPGGHCDSDADVMRVCRREAYEETGQDGLTTLTADILDIDIHTIPAGKRSRQHLHYDVRFAFQGDMRRPLVISGESNDLKWVPIVDIGRYTNMPSVLVLTKKLETI